MCWFLLRLKKLTRPKQKPKLDFKQLHNEMVRVEFASEAANLIGERITRNSDIQDDYTNLHEALSTAADKVIPIVNTQAKQEWMNSEILDLMELQRKCRREHNSINNWIKSLAVNAQKLKPIFIMHNVYSWKNWNVPIHS